MDVSHRIRGASVELVSAARQLRRRATPAEQALWHIVRDRRVGGLKFRRQQAIGHVVLDFVCPSCKLVVEVDGDVHDSRTLEDQLRTEQLEAYGYLVVRFRNEDVLGNPGRIAEEIARAATANV